MVSVGSKSLFKAPVSLSKLGGGDINAAGSPIKKAIVSAKPSEERDSVGENEDLEKKSTENEVQEEVSKETELEKKKNLDQLLKRNLSVKKDDKTQKDTEAKDPADKNEGKKIDDEWIKNSSAKDDANKSRFEKAREEGLQDQLRSDKDSIVKKYPGLDRAGASSGGANAPSASPGNNSSNSNDNSNNGNNLGSNVLQGNSNNSGLNMLSDNSRSHNHIHLRNDLGDGDSFRRPDHSPDVFRPDPGHSEHSHKAHSAFESLYTQGHIKENVIQTGSSEDALRITAGLRGLGVFSSIQQEGNSIRLSGFNSKMSHEIHEAQRNILGQEFLAGKITTFDFEGVNENIAGHLTKMLEAKAKEIGSTQHNIGSDCNEGVCKVSFGQKSETITENQQQQFAQNENSSDPKQDNPGQLA